MLKKSREEGIKSRGGSIVWNVNTLYLKISLQHLHALDIPHCKLTYYLASGTKATAYYYFAFNVQRQQEQQILTIF